MLDWPREEVEAVKGVYTCPFCSRKVAAVNDTTAIMVCAVIGVHVQYDIRGRMLNGNPAAKGFA
ncbi:MAG: hypothetical protein FVQ81_01985 [Candidatus Glassbacteria bacterium]|nr:hypothetical protein [Candidatus Glassbacteria bacterium]